MLEFGQSTAQDSAALIKDVNEADFMAEVVEKSQEIPVIVDFWAEWCGPCKTLGPMLEDAVKAARGKVAMAKLDVDKNQQLAAALAQQGLPLQSIPTVVAFWQGRPVDMFQGAIPKSEIDAFIGKLTGLAGDGGLGEALEAAEEMLAQGAAADAAETFAAVLGEEPNNAVAYGGLVRAYIAADQIDQAEALLTNVPDDISASAEVEAARAQLELARQAANAGPVAELRAAVDTNPDDHQSRFDLAQALHAAGETEAAVAELLELFRRDREWNEAAAKTQLFTIFDALKPQDPIVLNGRRKLSSMIFA
ncbi:MAG: tetratricopeptide repeat protein [Pseudomonadota bacterium]